jgi:AmmeMemoRadiSam system protein B/AmmeMemoRadiSam system protein A
MGLTFHYNLGCSGQEKPSPGDRRTAAAGRFYPADPSELKSTLASLFADAVAGKHQNVVAVICPHAGYVFSGTVAASGFNQADPAKKYDNVFVIASSHHISFPGASIYNKGDYMTPLGRVRVNSVLAGKLIAENPEFTFNPEADLHEHSLEVQVPFLQYHLKKEFMLVPVVLGTQSPETCRKIAQALKPYFNGNNLFVISTDFSHYPSDADARMIDQSTCDAIVSNSPDLLLKTIDETRNKHIPNLATGLCGWTSVLTLLYMTTGEAGISIKPVQYLNSGASKYGDKSQVVGYWSLAVTRGTPAETPVSGFNFTDDEKIALLKIARNTMEKYVRDRRIPEVDAKRFSENLNMHAGAFVTIRKRGELRGCIGRFTADIPLYQVVQQMAVAASTEDTRFEPVTVAETGMLEVEISVLSPMKRIHSPDEIILGKTGIYIKKGFRSGTFLPQVAEETGWTREEFLGHCARDKAGIGWDGWKDAELYVYEACVFSEHELSVRK